MSTKVQFKRGNTLQNSTYTGAMAEITVDTTLHQLHLHDGSTPGGTVIGSTAGGLSGGVSGDIPIQVGTGTTGYINIGPTGYVLASTGSTATWTSIADLTQGAGAEADYVQINNVQTGSTATYYLTLAESKDGTYSELDADSLLFYNPDTGTVTLPNVIPTTLNVTAGANIHGNLNVVSGPGAVTILSCNGVSFISNGPHGFLGGETVIPTASGLGLVQNQPYYVIGVLSTTHFILSDSRNGTRVGNAGILAIICVTGSSAALRVQGVAYINTSTQSTSTTTGALIVDGGVGIGGDLYVGGQLIVSGGSVARTFTQASVPTTPAPLIGDIWHSTTNDMIYRYSIDSAGNVFWIDITGPTVKAYV